MFSVYKETDDPTAINICTYGKFLHGEGRQLLTVSGRLLRLFRVNPYALVPPKNDNVEWIQRTKLECVFSNKFLSRIQSLAVARIPQYPDVDSMLLAFDDGKLSIVAIHAESNQLISVSLHSFETETLRGGFTKNFPPPIVRTDVNSRCAAMLVYAKHLAILPFQEGREFVHSYVTPLTSIDSRLENVIDMVFLDGYYEPTIMFLYEPLQTTAGRACIRNDTMCTMAVSINVFDKQMAVVWSQTSLPLDIDRIYSVPKPLGGALVVGANEIVYLSQAAPPCGIAVNSCFDGGYSKFPLKDMKHLSIAFDGSQTVYIGDSQFLVATKDGEIYSVVVVTDSSYAAKSISISKIAECSLPFCMTVCARGHLFVGSRLGDSQLFQYTVKEVIQGSVHALQVVKEEDAPMDEDDLELYGESHAATPATSSLVKEQITELVELDRLLNVAPIRCMTTGLPGKLADVFDGWRPDAVTDLVAATGHGKDGALCVFQRTLRPDVSTSTCIEGAQQLWAVGRCEDDSHKYVVVGRSRATLVLELRGEQMIELEEPLFITAEPTIAAGELADGAIAVQVTSLSITMVAEDTQVQLVEIESMHPVISACISDPWVSLLTQNGRLLLYFLEMEGGTAFLKPIDLKEAFKKVTGKGKVTAMSIYRDLSGLMTIDEDIGQKKTSKERRPNADVEMVDEIDEIYGDMDETERLLYGISSNKNRGKKGEATFSRKKRRHGEVQAARGGEESDAIDPNTIEPTYWLLVARDDGTLSIHELPSMKIVFECHQLGTQLPILIDEPLEERDEQTNQNGDQNGEAAVGRTPNPIQRAEERVAEICLTGMCFNQGRPILFVLVDDSVITYELYKHKNSVPGHLSIRFRRLPQTVFVRTSSYMGFDGKRNELQRSTENKHKQTFHPFDRVGNVMHGLYISGPCPYLFLVSPSNGLISHPMTIDGGIRGMTPFNNCNNPMGFLYLTEGDQSMRISKLPPEFSYESSYPVCKVPLNCTPHFVRYLFQSQVYTLVHSKSHRSNRICVVVNEERTIETREKPSTFVCPEVEEYTLTLISPEDWKPVPNAEIKMEEMEVVACCEEVVLRSESTITGFENYIAVGTICNYGEEVLVRGRLLLIEVIEVVPEPGMPTSNRKMKILYDKEQKGPVTSMCSSNGFLFTGMGQKVFIWQFRDNQLNGLAFLDLDYYIHHLYSLRNLVIACDVYASVHLLRYQERFKALSVMCRDIRKDAVPPMTSTFMVDGKHASVVMSDESGNVFLFECDNEEGLVEKMPVRAHLNAGTVINCWVRVKAHSSLILPPTSTNDIRATQSTQTAFYGSLDGSFGFLRPIKEKNWRRLNFLAQIMQEEIPCAGGLHPVGAKSARPAPELGERALIDLDFISQFMHLCAQEKKDLARKLGTNRYQIMDDLILLRKLRVMDNGHSLGDLILENPHVKYRNSAAGRSPIGVLRVYSEHVEWKDDASNDVARFPFVQIKGQRVSPPNKTKVQLQLCLQNDDQATFVFLHPGFDKEALIKERDLFKETLQQSLVAHRTRVAQLASKNETGAKTAELEAKQKMLMQNKQLEQLYKHLVSTKLINPQDFWTDYYKTSGQSEEQVGVSGGFLSTIAQNDGVNGVKLNLNTETIQAIFNTYPIVERKHIELVPHEMTEPEFWTKFFQSHYYYRQREVLPNPNDPFSECVRQDEAEIEKLTNLGVARANFDLNYLSDNLMIDGKKNDEVGEKQQLMRRCNYLSERILASFKANTDSSFSQPSTSSDSKETLTQQASGFASLNRGVDQVERRLESEELDSEIELAISQPIKVATNILASSNSLDPAVAAQRRMAIKRFLDTSNDDAILGGFDWMQMGRHMSNDLEEQNGSKTNGNGVGFTLAPSQMVEVRAIHDAVAELLKHFWTCFPATTPELETKLERMVETLAKYRKDQLAHAVKKFGEHHFDQCFLMLDQANHKMASEQAKK
ncbi:unnamed protein product, partial [Mesorhabditis belari]|uniref:BSD domain-containing protein n=1 Tax=Mesorhabditis belari TaxID=2138241 RepID=A0AAF3FF42_9BILA